MEKFEREKSPSTPEVILDLEQGYCKIAGNSFPGDPDHFYKPLLHWLDSVSGYFNAKVKLEFELEYFDGPSMGYLLRILQIFENVHKEGKNVTCQWVYAKGDDEIYDLGEKLSQILSLDIHLIEKEKNKASG